tara:strand:- start:167 stop:361 length:195 start_codon:yes stop_codon:yes gene_type:complete
MPKHIQLTTKQGATAFFVFSHALRLLRLQSSQGREDWTILSDKYEFLNNEIVRIKSNRQNKKEA